MDVSHDGTVIVGSGLRPFEGVSSRGGGEPLGIPEGWGTVAMVPIGYPVGKGHGPITRQVPICPSSHQWNSCHVQLDRSEERR